MSASNTAPAPANKGKKMVVIGAVVALLIIAAAGAFLFLKSRQAVDEMDQDHDAAPAPVISVPTFMPLETMVVNLADRGGDRFAQIGITLELRDAKSEEQIKQLMPSIRNGILLLVSQRSADELLLSEGKRRLAMDIQADIGRHLGIPPAPPRSAQSDEYEEDVPRPRNPVRRVLFSSFLIQ